MDKLENKYYSLFMKLDKLNNTEDIESSHILQDKLYRKFIKDICNDKLSSLEDIQKIADYMNKYVVKYDKEKNRWYA